MLELHLRLLSTKVQLILEIWWYFLLSWEEVYLLNIAIITNIRIAGKQPRDPWANVWMFDIDIMQTKIIFS